MNSVNNAIVIPISVIIEKEDDQGASM